MIHLNDTYFLKLTEPNRSSLFAIRKIILDLDNNVSETNKWGMPCFCFKQKPFCYLWVDKKKDEPYILVVERIHLDHPALEQDNRKRMKIFRIKARKNLPIRSILSILKDALALYKIGKDKIK